MLVEGEGLRHETRGVRVLVCSKPPGGERGLLRNESEYKKKTQKRWDCSAQALHLTPTAHGEHARAARAAREEMHLINF